ncbi:hypothetical protein [Bartonella raoultii]|uniref:hypothetical protein n=1 Tax=Bartonella raoultii TaxID=1457020 RepID=UPI001ABAA0C9|nr:hypothetical protein [Bartonella raoultii]
MQIIYQRDESACIKALFLSLPEDLLIGASCTTVEILSYAPCEFLEHMGSIMITIKSGYFLSLMDLS